MKHKRIIMGILAVSLMAIVFVPTVAAAEYFAVNMEGLKTGKDFTFTIDTSSAANLEPPYDTIYSFGQYVDTSSIVITIFDRKNVETTICPDWTRVSVSPDGNSIVIRLVKQDGLPSRASTVNAVGELTGPYADNTFFASCPGWGWGGHY